MTEQELNIKRIEIMAFIKGFAEADFENNKYDSDNLKVPLLKAIKKALVYYDESYDEAKEFIKNRFKSIL